MIENNNKPKPLINNSLPPEGPKVQYYNNKINKTNKNVRKNKITIVN